MRYAYKVFDELYGWISSYKTELTFRNIYAALNYKFEDEIESDGICYGKSNNKILEDLKQFLCYIVDERKDFYIEYWDGHNAKQFKNTGSFSDFISENKIDIFDDTISDLRLSIVSNVAKLSTPQNIPEYIHQIFEPYLFCELKTK